MSSTPAAEQGHDDYFDDGCVHGAEREDCRVCSAAIHRLNSDAPQPPDGDMTVWPQRPLEPAYEPQAVPPERIFLRACHPDSPNHNCSWSVDYNRRGSISYTRTSTAEALAEALRGLSRYAFVGWGECWCDKPPFSANIVDHQTACTSARTALARWEKGES